MARKNQKRPLEAITGRYGAIPNNVMDSPAFMGAGHTAKALLFELMRQHTGINNGHYQLSFSWLKKRGWNSRDVIQRARAELIDRGLIIQTRYGGLNSGPSLYAVTWLQISNFVGLDIQQSNYHPGAWSMMNDLSMDKKIKSPVPPNGKGNTVSRSSPIPPAGTA